MFATFVKNSDVILLGRNFKGTFGDFDSEIEPGFLSFLILVACEYFKRCDNEFKDKCSDIKPDIALG